MLLGFKVIYNDKEYMAVAAQDHSYIKVYKGLECVDTLTPSRVEGMFCKGVPNNITLDVAVMSEYRKIYMEKQ